jgi:hypothetical protein
MQFDQLKRRKFITLLGGAAVSWPLGVRAQQGERMRRVGVFMNTAADDTVFQTRVGAFLQGLALCWWPTLRRGFEPWILAPLVAPLRA